MMKTLYGDAPFALLGMGLHMLFDIALFVGLVLFLVYVIKFMKKDVLKKWTMWVLIVALVGCLLTSGLAWKGMQKMHDNFGPKWGQTTEVPSLPTTPAPTK